MMMVDVRPSRSPLVSPFTDSVPFVLHFLTFNSAKSELATAHAAMGGMGAMGDGAARRGGSVGGGGGSTMSMSPSLDGIDGENLEHKVCG